jgi:hypothetical protein
MATKLTRLTDKIAIQLHLVAQLCHSQFSRHVASPETFGYILVQEGLVTVYIIDDLVKILHFMELSLIMNVSQRMGNE